MQYPTTEFTPWLGLVGGGMIGAASVLLLLSTGRIAGISGIAAGLMSAKLGEVSWRLLFVIGLVAAALLYPSLAGRPVGVDVVVEPWLMMVGGFLVGFGTRMGSGCTAGHGISGIARLSARSVAATATFFLSALVTVYLVRHTV